MSSSSLLKYSGMNADAILCLQEQRFDEAVQIFKKALSELQTTFDASLQMSIGQYSDADVALVSVPVLTAEQSQEFLNASGSLFAFFPRAFHLMCENPADLVFSHVLVVLIYNLALATHIRSVQTGKPNQRHITQILNLYQNGLTLSKTFFTPEDSARMLPVQLALTNNQGFVFSQEQWFSETRERLSWLIHLLELSSCGDGRVSMEDYQIFFESVCVFLDGNDLSLAPAA